MRKMLSFCNLLIFIIVCAGLVMGCFLTISKPEKTFVLEVAAQSSGVLVAEQVPGIAQDVLGYSETALAVQIENFSQEAFQKWSAGVIARLDIHPLLKVNFTKLITLVKIDIELADNQGEIVRLSYNVIQNFTIGLKAGLK